MSTPTPALELPLAFELSYKNFESYPDKLVCPTSYHYAIEASKARLNAIAPRLFTNKEKEVKVVFRDLLLTDPGYDKWNIFDDAELKELLGDQSVLVSRIDPQTSAPVYVHEGPLATKQDPRCRFIYFYGGHSRKELNVTKTMLLRILTFYQVMPTYLDFISVFGSQDDPRDLRYSGFREQTFITDGQNPRGPAVESLGRSGRQYQLCYNLKGVACTSPADATAKKKKWSIRQAAFHHQFDVKYGTSLWIVTKGDLEIKNRIEEMTGPIGRLEDRKVTTPEDSFRTSLSVHLLCCNWAAEEWRWYIQWLEIVIDDETRMAKAAPRENTKARREYVPDDLQRVQSYEDDTNEVIMILEANVEILTSLRDFYERLVGNKDFTVGGNSSEDVIDFAIKVNDMIYDLRMQIARARLLAKLTADSKNLIMQHLQSQATQKMEILTEKMHKIGSMSQREASAMKIITVVTLIYLPATFVSTFFSTDIVKYQGQGNEGGSFSDTALYRWLQISLPLTALTLGFSYIAFRMADKPRKDEETLPFSTKDNFL